MDDTKKTAPRRMKIALIASLAVNVLVIGAVIGAMSHWSGPSGKRAGERSGLDGAIGIYGHALEQEDRRDIRKTMFADHGERRDMRAQLTALVKQAVQVLEQSPFDKAAFQDILQQQQGQIKDRSDAFQGALVDHIATMSDEQRVVYANRLVKILERGERRYKEKKEKKEKEKSRD